MLSDLPAELEAAAQSRLRWLLTGIVLTPRAVTRRAGTLRGKHHPQTEIVFKKQTNKTKDLLIYLSRNCLTEDGSCCEAVVTTQSVTIIKSVSFNG